MLLYTRVVGIQRLTVILPIEEQIQERAQERLVGAKEPDVNHTCTSCSCLSHDNCLHFSICDHLFMYLIFYVLIFICSIFIPRLFPYNGK